MTELLAEVCVDSVAGARAAQDGGGGRLELCSGLEVGGLTPSVALVRAAAQVLPTNVLIRPRAGDFCYDADEIDIMASDVASALAEGGVGVVIGALTPDGEVDVESTRRLLDAAAGAPVTFHRAFDMSRDPLRAMDTLMELGITRLLSSGCAPSAPQGAHLLAELIRRAGADLVVMPGGGVTPETATDLVRATGAREIHFSASVQVPSAMRYRNAAVKMGGGTADEYARRVTSADRVRETIAAARRGAEG